MDEGGAPAPAGSRVVQTAQGGALDPNGPPTTLSDRATDRLMFLQVLTAHVMKHCWDASEQSVPITCHQHCRNLVKLSGCYSHSAGNGQLTCT